MELNEPIAQKLVEEMKKPGRECMYDMSNSSYKNNHKKQRIWTEIASAIGIDRGECQTLWKTLRRRHKSALNKSCGRSGSERIELNGFSKFLIAEMDYFQNFWEDKEPTVTNYTDSNTDSFRELFDEMARDPEVNHSSIDCFECPTDNSQLDSMSSTPIKFNYRRKRSKIDEAEIKYKESIKNLNNLATKVFETSTEKRDPFFLALEDEFSKVSENLRSALKIKLMALIVEHQQ